MRSVKFLAAAGAATILSMSAASAADMPYGRPLPPPPAYAPPPVEDSGGWYLRGDIGFSSQQVKKLDIANYAGLSSLDSSYGFDSGGIYGIGVGYQLNSWLRIDATGQYRGSAGFHGQDRVTFPNSGQVGFGADTYGARKSEWVAMANAYVDLGTWYNVTPFVGAGVGAARVTIANFTDQGVSYLDPAIGGVGPSSAYASTGSKWNLAWALHAGVAYKVDPRMTVELGYSYMNLGDGVTGPLTTFDGFTRNNAFTFKEITSHDVKLGVRWLLDCPPVYAAPPLVRKG